MEFQRRVASGRLSEIFGEATLSTDKYLRHFNFHALTEQSYAMLDDETRRIVDAYAAGVNAYIEDRTPAQLGLEFALLGLQGVDFEIEKWSSVDSMVWAEMMIYDQSDKLEMSSLQHRSAGSAGEEQLSICTTTAMTADDHPSKLGIFETDRPARRPERTISVHLVR
jgi:penicillin amidase